MMELNSKMMKEERFSYNGLSVTDHEVITLKGSIQGRDVNVAINPRNVKRNISDQNEYKIHDLQVTTGHYDYISQFHVVKTDRNTNIILG